MDYICTVSFILSVFVLSFAQDTTNNNCRVKESCVSVHACQLVDKYMKTGYPIPNILKKFQICGFDLQIPRICCVDPDLDNGVIHDAINFNNTTKHTTFRPTTEATNAVEHQLRPEYSRTSTTRTHLSPTTPRPQLDIGELPNYPHHVNSNPIINGRVTPPTEYLQEQIPLYPHHNGTYEDHYNISIASKVTEPEEYDLLPNRNECGHQKSTALIDRVIGGENTEINEFPWMVRLKMQKQNNASIVAYSCGGSLISDRYVITAAHCANNNARLHITEARLGEWNGDTKIDCDIQNHCNDPPVDIPVEKIIVHPDFTGGTSIKGDIALIRLQEPVKFTEFIRPICLPMSEFVTKLDVSSISEYYAAGWGKTEYGTFSPVKRKVIVNTVDVDTCKLSYAGKITDDIVPTIICAGGRKGYDTCSGDSGGPLMQYIEEQGNKNWYLYGVISLGKYPCGKEGQPAVYTRITHYIDWIKDNLSR